MNIIPSRRHQKYTLGIPAQLQYTSDKIAYWVAEHENSKKNVFLLHGFTRNSGKMNRRAEIYWNQGYNVYLVDNKGHGLSSNVLFPSGFQYSLVVRGIIKELGINKPIIHGASMGAIAASYIAQKEPEIPKIIICEALPAHFDNLYREIMAFMRIPFLLFFWVPWLSHKIVWRQFSGYDVSYYPDKIQCPIFLIHGENDYMFKPHEHLTTNIKHFGNNSSMESWLVPNSLHTRMDGHEDYEDRLMKFLLNYN